MVTTKKHEIIILTSLARLEMLFVLSPCSFAKRKAGFYNFTVFFIKILPSITWSVTLKTESPSGLQP